MKPRRAPVAIALILGLLVVAMAGGTGDPVSVEIPSGSTLPVVAEILDEAGVVSSARLFLIYTRIRRADRRLKAGTYEMVEGSSMRTVLRTLTRGEVETVAFTVPEGFMLQQMVPRIAEVTGTPEADVLAALRGPGIEHRYGVPGPGIEGYLFPDTYRFAPGVPVESVVTAMVDRYKAVWTPERRALLEASGMTEVEIVTLASIIQAEARQVTEMARISGVYHNRLDSGWLLQADPTVLYALGGYRERLLYAAIDSVEDNPYNTYSQRGLPPGPIGSPGELAIDAALVPEDHDFMYFVAWPDGFHEFTRTLAEHNAAKNNSRGARERAGN